MEKDLRDIAEQDFISEQKATGFLANSYPTLEDKDSLPKELQDRKRFVEAFPRLKRKLQENIRKLRALADHLDQVHRGCTISHVVTNSTSVASGVLGILGLALAPMTAGGSLLLSATGLGWGQ